MHEAENLKSVQSMIKDKEICKNIPQLIYFGTFDEITFLVTRYVSVQKSEFDFYSPLTDQNLEILDRQITKAIDFLTEYQRATTAKQVNATELILPLIEKQKNELNINHSYKDTISAAISELAVKVSRLNGIKIPICSVHGDFDFFQNIMFNHMDIFNTLSI